MELQRLSRMVVPRANVIKKESYEDLPVFTSEPEGSDSYAGNDSES